MELNSDFLSALKNILYIFTDACLFAFTTIPGIIIISAIFFTYIIAKIQNRFRIFRLAWISAGNTSKPGIREYLPQLWIELTEFAAKIVTSLPVLFGTAAILIFLTAFSSGMKSMDTFLENERKIKALSLAIAHVKDHSLDMELKVTEQTADTTSVSIRYFDYSTQGLTREPKEFVLNGDDIYIDCLVVNFDYAFIEQGQKTNLVVPYRIFSNKTEQINGIALAGDGFTTVPDYYKVADKDLYGIEPQEFETVMKEIFTSLGDQAKLKKSGIRSLYGSAVHTKMREGETYQIFIEQSGGLVLKLKKL